MMSLSDFIAANAAAIARECEAFARSLLPAAESLDSVALRDHAEAMLIAIAADMKRPQTPEQQAEKSKGNTPNGPGAPLTAAEHHGMGRAREGFTFIQGIAEFRALRAATLRLWLQSSPSLALNHVEELIRFNEGVDQALAESVLRFAAAMARDRNQFLAVLSHELRTPLGTIAASTRMQLLLAQRQHLPIEALERTSRAAGHMQSILDDLLDYVRAGERGGMRLTPRAAAMDRICEQVIADLLASHPSHRIEFTASGDLQGFWDEHRIAQAVSNLIGNAIKYSEATEPVAVKVSEIAERDAVVVEVRNSSAPIPPETLKSLFQPLVRRGPDPSGVSLGLGLYVVREVARAHGGDVDAESTEAATVFRMTLPKTAGHVQASGFGHLGMH